MLRYVFDLETDGLLPVCTKVHSLVLQNLDTGEVIRCRPYNIEAGLSLMREATELIGHNVLGFDLPALKKLHSWEPKARVIDTLVLSKVTWPDRMDLVMRDSRNKAMPQEFKGNQSLAAWGYRLGVLKGTFGETTDWAEWSQEMEDYCVQDVVVTKALYDKLLTKDIPQDAWNLEHGFRHLISLQEQHGFRFDLDAARGLYTTLAKRRLELEAELQKVFPPRIETLKTPAYYIAAKDTDETQRLFKCATKAEAKAAGYRDSEIAAGPLRTKEHPFNPGSNDQIAARLTEKYGWKPVELTDGGKPKVTETIVNAMVYPEAKLLAEHMKVSKIIGMVAEGDQAWFKVERKGRIHGSVNTNGAVTGRCTHSEPNVAQVPKVRVGKGPDGKKAPLKLGAGGYGYECRSLFLPDPGHVLVGWDASGLELRCLAHFMGRYDGGAYAKVLLEGDIHSENQKAAGLPTRDNAKTFIYAFLYGAGDEKIGSIVGKGASEGKALKAKFLRGLPALGKLKEAVDSAVETKGGLRGLDGRTLPIRSKHTALNTLLQSAGAVVMKKALTIMYDSLIAQGLKYGTDFAFVANIHDEVQTTSRPEVAETVGKAGVAAIRAAGEYFKFRCPLDGEFKIGSNWAETH